MRLPRHLISASQLDRKLPQLKKAAGTLAVAAPSTGWIKALRISMGLTTVAFAARMAVKQQSATELESSERAGTITLASLRRAANALDADLVFALVPRRGIRETIATRARLIARQRVAPVAHSMRLEAQGLSKKEVEERIDELAKDLERRPRELWR